MARAADIVETSWKEKEERLEIAGRKQKLYWSNLEREIVELEKLEAGPRAQESNLKVPSDKKRKLDDEKLSRRMEGLSLRTTDEEITRVVLELSRLSLQEDTPSGQKTELTL